MGYTWQTACHSDIHMVVWTLKGKRLSKSNIPTTGEDTLFWKLHRFFVLLTSADVEIKICPVGVIIFQNYYSSFKMVRCFCIFKLNFQDQTHLKFQQWPGIQLSKKLVPLGIMGANVQKCIPNALFKPLAYC